MDELDLKIILWIELRSGGDARSLTPGCLATCAYNLNSSVVDMHALERLKQQQQQEAFRSTARLSPVLCATTAGRILTESADGCP